MPPGPSPRGPLWHHQTRPTPAHQAFRSSAEPRAPALPLLPAARACRLNLAAPARAVRLPQLRRLQINDLLPPASPLLRRRYIRSPCTSPPSSSWPAPPRRSSGHRRCSRQWRAASPPTGRCTSSTRCAAGPRSRRRWRRRPPTLRRACSGAWRVPRAVPPTPPHPPPSQVRHGRRLNRAVPAHPRQRGHARQRGRSLHVYVGYERRWLHLLRRVRGARRYARSTARAHPTRHRRYNTQKGFPLSAYLDTCTLTVREEDAATAAAPTSASSTPAATGALADTTHAPLLLLLLLRLPLSLTHPPHSQVQSALILAVTATLQERPKSPVVRTAIGLTYLATAACVCAAPDTCTREKTRVSHPHRLSLSLSLSGFCSARCAQRGCWRRCRSWPRALR